MIERIGVAVLRDGRGRYLIAQRPRGGHLQGLWEFPGGKCEGKESVPACIRRECAEEVGIRVSVGSLMMKLSYHYPGRVLTLVFYDCRKLSGIPKGLEGQKIKWVSPKQLDRYPHPEANLTLIKRLKLAKALNFERRVDDVIFPGFGVKSHSIQ